MQHDRPLPPPSHPSLPQRARNLGAVGEDIGHWREDFCEDGTKIRADRLNFSMIHVSYVQVCGVAPADSLVERPLMGELFSGFPVFRHAGILREPPKQFVLHRAFCFGTPAARTPHESKSLTGLRGSKRYTVRRESRGQFLNNPCGWLNLQAEGLEQSNMRVRTIRGGAYLS